VGKRQDECRHLQPHFDGCLHDGRMTAIGCLARRLAKRPDASHLRNVVAFMSAHRLTTRHASPIMAIMAINSIPMKKTLSRSGVAVHRGRFMANRLKGHPDVRPSISILWQEQRRELSSRTPPKSIRKFRTFNPSIAPDDHLLTCWGGQNSMK